MTIIGLVTGAIWGQPMWGTWWAWDPRLTSFLILFLFYLGYIALWEAVEDGDTAADLTSALCLVGSVFAFLSRYAVNFWNQGWPGLCCFSLLWCCGVHGQRSVCVVPKRLSRGSVCHDA